MPSNLQLKLCLTDRSYVPRTHAKIQSKMSKIHGIRKSLSEQIDKTNDWFSKEIMELISTRFPNMMEVANLLEIIQDHVKSDDNVNFGEEVEDKEDGDGKWRPYPIILALLCKYQEICDADTQGIWFKWYNSNSVKISDIQKQNLLHRVFAAYWHLLRKVTESLQFFKISNRTAVKKRLSLTTSSKEEEFDLLRTHLSQKISFDVNDILYVHRTDKAKDVKF